MSSVLQIDGSQKGIWRYHFYYPEVKDKFRLSLGEGKTPAVEMEGIIFKREDQNPTGSIKDRGMAYQISDAWEKGEKRLVLSSSGNAAIAAAAYCALAKIDLTVFISPKINPQKREKLLEYGPKIIETKRPVSESFRLAKEEKIRNLRPATDPIGEIGYRSLAFEIEEEIGQVEAVFFPVSSGTTLVGVAQGFGVLGSLPQLHAVQTSAVCPMANRFDKDFRPTKTSLAEALVARISPRKKKVLELVGESKGSGWVISDEEIKKAWQWLEAQAIFTSAEGAAALAAIWKAKRKGFNLGKKIVCLLTGRKY